MKLSETPTENGQLLIDHDRVLKVDIESENQSDTLNCQYITAREGSESGMAPFSFFANQSTFEDLERTLQNELKNVRKRKIKFYYQRQINLLQEFREDNDYLKDFDYQRPFARNEISHDGKGESHIKYWQTTLTRLALVVNILLFVAKIVAAVLSGSLVVLSSVVDSAMDLTTGLVMYCTNRAISRRNLQKYPRGRTRLEPLAIIVISVIMGAANVQVVVQSVESMIKRSMAPQTDLVTLIIMMSTVVLKLGLYIVCLFFAKQSSSVKVLMQDHRNDCLSNTVAVVCAFLASKYWTYLDPIAAILVSLYIIFTWVQTGFQHVRILSGRAANSDIINRIVKVCIDHKPQILSVDTVYAYHFGIKYLVEAHVVLSENITLKEAHDISEPLQQKIEQLPFVERAFVHVDYDTSHRPEFEHKIV